MATFSADIVRQGRDPTPISMHVTWFEPNGVQRPARS